MSEFYPPYHCDVLAEKAVELQKEIDSLAREIIDLKAKREDIMDYLKSQGLPLQAL